eukprot:1748851-Prorocentrum_lima.AAC.1
MEPWGRARGIHKRNGAPSEAQGPAHHNAAGNPMPSKRWLSLCFLLGLCLACLPMFEFFHDKRV